MRLSDLTWESRFVEQLPGDPEKTNATRAVREACYSETLPTAVANPKLIGWSDELASELGLSCPTLDDQDEIAVLAGNRIAPGMRPYAARYGGHQFGHWAGQLGDGRAITLGEASFEERGRTEKRGRFEFQLKGAGPTPYSRRADGRAVLRSSIREFLCSEAMHALGVPTTRALSLVTTGEPVIRDQFYDGNPQPEPGAIVCRVAPSFLRFGSFEILAANQEHALLRQLTDFLIREHYPELDLTDPDVIGKLFDEIARRTARMIADWMRVGFVHGVMNTDNMSALGLTIDYGPYGWLEPYDPGWTPNTTDAEGRRYRFGQQPAIAQWNLARFGEALLPLIGSVERIQSGLDVYRDTFIPTHERMLAEKLGLERIDPQLDPPLIEELFALLQLAETDYTIFFRALCDWTSPTLKDDGKTGADFIHHISPSFYAPETLDTDLRTRWATWASRYSERVTHEGVPVESRRLVMKAANPKYVLRNYLAQNAIAAAENGDLSIMERTMKVLRSPYDEHAGDEDLAAKRPEWARHAPGCSSLSCSS